MIEPGCCDGKSKSKGGLMHLTAGDENENMESQNRPKLDYLQKTDIRYDGSVKYGSE